MSTEAEELVNTIIKAWSTKDWALLETVHATDWIDHSSPDGMNDLNALKGQFGLFTQSFPDLDGELVSIIANGDDVAYQYIMRGTHEVDFMGIPATGKKIEMRGMTFLKMVDGKCTEAWGLMDQMTLMKQIGAIPA